MKERILIADDEEVVRVNIQEFLQAEAAAEELLPVRGISIGD